MNTKELGGFGERIACEYLVKKGYKILAKNYRISFGEIDIIAKKPWRLFKKNDKTIHFIEVKSLGSPTSQYSPRYQYASLYDFLPEQRVDYKKQKKLRQLAEIWLEKNKYPQNTPYQIDIIGILVDQTSKKSKLHYFSNVVEDVS